MRVQLVTFLCLATTLGCSAPVDDDPVEVTPQEVDEAIAADCSTAEATRQTADGETEPSHRIVCDIELKYYPKQEEQWAYLMRWRAFDSEGVRLDFDVWSVSPDEAQGPSLQGPFAGSVYLDRLEPGVQIFINQKADIPQQAELLRWHVYWCDEQDFDRFEFEWSNWCEKPSGEFYRDYSLTPDDGELDDYEFVIPDEQP